MVYLLTILIIFFAIPAASQVSTQPIEPVQPPWYYYWPTENADNFEKSELGSSTLGGGGLERRSNVEVNRQEEREQSSNYVPNQRDSIDVDLDEPQVDVSSRPPSSSKLIKWVDDNGVVHVTNDPGSIPEKYRNQAGN